MRAISFSYLSFHYLSKLNVILTVRAYEKVFIDFSCEKVRSLQNWLPEFHRKLFYAVRHEDGNFQKAWYTYLHMHRKLSFISWWIYWIYKHPFYEIQYRVYQKDRDIRNNEHIEGEALKIKNFACSFSIFGKISTVHS